jgi:DNA-binding NtrC family response regulator
VKILAATQIPLSQAVTSGRFRADLAARLLGWNLRVPPLRARVEDIPLLLTTKIRDRLGRDPDLKASLVQRLCLHRWPLNVRELDSLASRLADRCVMGRALSLSDLPETFATVIASEAASPVTRSSHSAVSPASRTERAFQRQDIDAMKAALESTQGNLTEACSLLRISRGRGYRLLAASQRRSRASQ